MSEMVISAIAPWFGGKRNLAPEICREFGPHRAYWEPFCGGLPVLLAKEPATMETVNDLHGDLINLARVVQHRKHGPILYRELRRCWMDEDLYDRCHRVLRERFDPNDSLLDTDRAFAYFVASWLGRNGTSGLQPHRVGKAFCVRYTKNGGHGGTRFCNAIDSIPAWRRRMRGLTILRRDAFELLERIEDAAGVVIYCDPPYLEKAGTYQHDFMAADHHRLAEALCRFKHTRVIVSYYAHPLLEKLYPGWTQRSFDVSKAMAHQGQRGENSVRATEVLLINGPSLVEPSDSMLALAAV